MEGTAPSVDHHHCHHHHQRAVNLNVVILTKDMFDDCVDYSQWWRWQRACNDILWSPRQAHLWTLVKHSWEWSRLQRAPAIKIFVPHTQKPTWCAENVKLPIIGNPWLLHKQTHEALRFELTLLQRYFGARCTFFLLIRQFTICFKDFLLEKRLVGAPFCCQCILYMFFYPNTIDVWVEFSLSVHKENFFHHCKLKLMIMIMMLDRGVLLHI